MSALAAVALAAVFTRPMERVATLDPAMGQSVYDSSVAQLIYETVLTVDYEARPYRLAPGVCDLPRISDDGMTYSFNVLAANRDRDALTAHDVVRSLERLRDPALVSPNAWILKSVDTMSADGDTNFVVRLSAKCHFLPWLMAMSPASVTRADGGGTGAYRLDRWRKNHAMEFVRRVPAQGGFDRVRYLVVDDPSTQWLMFLKGELDLLTEVQKENWDVVISPDGTLSPALSSRGIRLHSIPKMEVMYMGVNMKDPVLGRNKPLRQALNAAFDRDAWVRFLKGRVIAANGPVPPAVPGRFDAPMPYSFDLERAKRLMTLAGYENGIDPATGRRLVLTLSIGRANQESRQAGELVAAFYERIGIKLELSFHTWDAFLKAVNEGRTQLYRMAWVGDYPDAENFLQLFLSANANPGPNHSDYSSPEFDRLYALARDTGDEGERNRIWAKCCEVVCEDCPWVFVHFNKANSLVHGRVGGYVPGDFPYGQERFFTVAEGR